MGGSTKSDACLACLTLGNGTFAETRLRASMIGETGMIRQPFASEADRLTYAKWARVIAIVYGGVALILFGLVVLSEPSGVVAPDRPSDRAVASVAVPDARGTARPAACQGRHDMSSLVSRPESEASECSEIIRKP
jgi:hypothetical protein